MAFLNLKMKWNEKILYERKAIERCTFSLPFRDVEMARNIFRLRGIKVFERMLPFTVSESDRNVIRKESISHRLPFSGAFQPLSESIKGSLCSKTFLQCKRHPFRAISMPPKGREKASLAADFQSHKIFRIALHTIIFSDPQKPFRVVVLSLQ